MIQSLLNSADHPLRGFFFGGGVPKVSSNVIPYLLVFFWFHAFQTLRKLGISRSRVSRVVIIIHCGRTGSGDDKGVGGDVNSYVGYPCEDVSSDHRAKGFNQVAVLRVTR